jgi:hypothetical protein
MMLQEPPRGAGGGEMAQGALHVKQGEPAK